jgi:hypothetical protein
VAKAIAAAIIKNLRIPLSTLTFDDPTMSTVPSAQESLPKDGPAVQYTFIASLADVDVTSVDGLRSLQRSFIRQEPRYDAYIRF